MLAIMVLKIPLSKFAIDSLTTTMPPTVCHQKTISGQCCSMHFTYKGVTYNSCTDADHHTLWCSLDSQYRALGELL